MKYFIACLLSLFAIVAQSEESVLQEVPHVTIQTNLGVIELELNPEKAPETVKNFLTYVSENFYEETIFHRVIKDFVIQGGGYAEDYYKKPPYAPIPNEASNGLKNKRGTIAMARNSADPHSATSQFFINIKDNEFLDYRASTSSDWGYCVFGRVVEGMEIVDKIADLPTEADGPFKGDLPQAKVIIEVVTAENLPPTTRTLEINKVEEKVEEINDEENNDGDIEAGLEASEKGEKEETTDEVVEEDIPAEEETSLDNEEEMSIDHIEEGDIGDDKADLPFEKEMDNATDEPTDKTEKKSEEEKAVSVEDSVQPEEKAALSVKAAPKNITEPPDAPSHPDTPEPLPN